MTPFSPTPDCAASILVVGKDVRGRWLVQESQGSLEGHFISFEAAMSFARAERHSYPGATIAVSCAPLLPIVAC